jgi:hypothetical protein
LRFIWNFLVRRPKTPGRRGDGFSGPCKGSVISGALQAFPSFYFGGTLDINALRSKKFGKCVFEDGEGATALRENRALFGEEYRRFYFSGRNCCSA